MSVGLRVLHGLMILILACNVGLAYLQWSGLGFPDGYLGPSQRMLVVIYPVIMGVSGVLLVGHGVLAARSRGWAWSVGVTMASAVCIATCLLVGSVLGGMYPSVGG